MLTQTIRAGQKSGVIDEDSAKRVAVDTTVMEKNIAYPTDARLYERARGHLAELAQEAGVDLRQSYARLAPRLALQVSRYSHTKQFKHMRKGLKRLKGYTGRVMRDLVVSWMISPEEPCGIRSSVLQLIMETDVEGIIGAGRHERSGDRTTWRNGYHDRSLDTRLGTLNLRVPKLRQGSYFRGFLEAARPPSKRWWP